MSKKKNKKRVIKKIVIKPKSNNDYYDHMYKEKEKWGLKNILAHAFSNTDVQALALFLISIILVISAIKLTGAP